MKRKIFSDNHAHFTGSLPLKFIWNELKKNCNSIEDDKVWSKIFSNITHKEFINLKDSDKNSFYLEFSNGITRFFDEKPKKNIVNFFMLYSFVQSFTKSSKTKESRDLYINGTCEITKKYFLEGVERFELIAGASKRKEKTLDRIDAMCKGFEAAERILNKKSIGKIRITFIRNDKKRIKNFSNETLSEIMRSIEKNKMYEERISGFDFSGEEAPNDFATTCGIIKEIEKYNKYRRKNKKKELLVSVHAGENLFDFDAVDYIDFFYKLVKLPINAICHGTFLWIPKNLIQIERKEDLERNLLLKEISKKNIKLEICPTANVLLTPVQEYQNINLRLLVNKGVNYTLNTDNKTIFSTDIRTEYTKLIK